MTRLVATILIGFQGRALITRRHSWRLIQKSRFVELISKCSYCIRVSLITRIRWTATRCTWVRFRLAHHLLRFLASQHTHAFPSQIPSNIAGKEDVVFGNLEDIHHFHERFFEPEIRKYASGGDFLPEDVGHCFVSFGDRLAGLYVDYCVNKEDSMAILVGDSENFFGRLQLRYDLSEPLQSFLIKPVQRITKYQLLLKELRDCCERSSAGELSEGLDVMMAVPKKANEAIHLRMLQVRIDHVILLLLFLSHYDIPSINIICQL